MSSPIYCPPNSAHYAVTPEKYAALVAALKSNQEAVGLSVTGNQGSVSYEGVQFSWSYDGAQTLDVQIVAVHSWKAKIAGNQFILDELNRRLISVV